MTALSQEDLLKELKAGKFRPIYLLMGEEPYPIDVVSDYIENNTLPEADRAFNQVVVYGHDDKVKARDVVREAQQYPMMAERRVVIVKEAQALDKLQELDFYAQQPQPTTVLVLCHKYKSVDKRGKLIKSIDKAGGAVMETKKLYDNQVQPWVVNRVTQLGMSIEEKAAAMLAESVGTNLSSIVAAIEKMRLAVGADSKLITSDMVSKYVGVSNEYNTFTLCDAIMARDVAKADRIIKAFSLNEKQHPVQPIISTVYSMFQKLMAYHYLRDKSPATAASVLEVNPFLVTKTYEPASRKYSAMSCMQIMALLRTYDMRSKGFGWPAISNGDMLTQLAHEVMTCH